MRDAFGGAFMIKIFLVFIVIYVGFTALSLNYAKAFRAKNIIIEYLETEEISDLNMLITGSRIKEIEDVINNKIKGKLNYNPSNENFCDSKGKVPDGITTDKLLKKTYCSNSGFIIEETGRADNTKGIIYTVRTYVNWNLPFLNGILTVGNTDGKKSTLGGNPNSREILGDVWEISGETRIIVRE